MQLLAPVEGDSKNEGYALILHTGEILRFNTQIGVKYSLPTSKTQKMSNVFMAANLKT